jgi:thiol-disulfide isomerase/thioredoxin
MSGDAGPGVPPDGAAAPDHPTPVPPARRRPRPVFLILGLVLAGALAVGLFTGVGTGGTGGGPGSRPVAGSTVPAFSLPRLGGGQPVGVPADGAGGGRPAILVFFASWCTDCATEIPRLAALYRHQQAAHSPLARVALIGIDGADPRGAALAFVHRSGVTFPVGVDPTYDVTEGKFYFVGLPDAVCVRGDGTIAAVEVGPVSAAAFTSWERRLLAPS